MDLATRIYSLWRSHVPAVTTATDMEQKGTTGRWVGWGFGMIAGSKTHLSLLDPSCYLLGYTHAYMYSYINIPYTRPLSKDHNHKTLHVHRSLNFWATYSKAPSQTLIFFFVSVDETIGCNNTTSQQLHLRLMFRNPANQLRLVYSLSHYLRGFLHPRWLFGISSINSSCTSDGNHMKPPAMPCSLWPHWTSSFRGCCARKPGGSNPM